MPIIVVYPDFSEKTDIADSNGLKQQIKKLWEKLPVLRDNMNKVPTIHVPMDKHLIRKSLEHDWFKVTTKTKSSKYYW